MGFCRTDPEFDSGYAVFRYARVFETPMLRWTTFETKRIKTPMPDEVLIVKQQRVYTALLWFIPET
ncbi:MAG: DUF3604 domain-containing protein [Rhizobiaceae bacterium]